MTFLLLSILGVLAGIASGFFGIGGGSIIVPILMAFGFGIKEAVGISVVQMVFSSVYGSFLNHKQGLLRLKDGIFLGIGGAVGAFGSGFVVKLIPEWILVATFAFTLLFSIFRFFKSPLGAEKSEKNSPILFFVAGAFTGVIAISLGIGGAIFLTPIMVGFLHVDIKKAVSMGLFFVVFSSISGFLSMSLNGLINYKIGLILGVSSLIGAYFGTKLSFKIEKKLQKKLLLILYIIMFIAVLTELLETL